MRYFSWYPFEGKSIGYSLIWNTKYLNLKKRGNDEIEKSIYPCLYGGKSRG